MRKKASKSLTRRQKAELAALAAMPDDAIDLSESPEVSNWKGPRRGLFYRPLKQQLTLRLDADVLAWFKSRATTHEGYQTGINRALREHVQKKARKAG